MDAILTGLLNFGIGGCMAAAVVAFSWRLVSKTLPDMQAAQSAALQRQQQVFLSAIDKVETRWQRVSDELCDRLERIETHLAEKP